MIKSLIKKFVEYKMTSSKKLCEYHDGIQVMLMVKNGEDLITESLESFVGQVDRFVILDTGSTDKTIELIEEFRTKHKQDVVLVREEFQGFDKSRNSLLDHASGWKGRWSIMIDDSYILEGNLRESLTSKMNGMLYSVAIHDELIKYPSSRIIKTGWLNEIRYVNSVHEYLNHASFGTVDGFKFVDMKCKAHQLRTSERKLSDIANFIKSESICEGDICRKMYYLAVLKRGMYQAGKCTLQEVYDAFIARINLGGDPEEKMFALITLGGLYEMRGDKVGAVKCYLLAANTFQPRMGECYYYAWLLSEDKEHLLIAYLNRDIDSSNFRFPFIPEVYGNGLINKTHTLINKTYTPLIPT